MPGLAGEVSLSPSMRIKIALFAGVLFLTLSSFAQPRYVTLATSGAVSNEVAVLEIGPSEVAELVSYPSSIDPMSNGINIEIGGRKYQHYLRARRDSDSADPLQPIIVAGPAVIKVQGNMFCTFKVSPDVWSADKSITVAPGAGGARVALECSTDLVNWTASTNGVYTNLPSAKFFRIKAERIP